MSIDVHTHLYLPRYIQILRERNEVPFVRKDKEGVEKLVILPKEDEDQSTQYGRKIADEYWSVEEKLAQMEKHSIASAVVSLANPWLDFMSAEEQVKYSILLNSDIEEICAAHPGKFYAFGVLPFKDVQASVKELERLATLPHSKGAIVSTLGCGNGMDDPTLEPIYETAARLGLMLFVHPHYGVGNENFGGYGHSLYLALGFPFETTTCLARIILAGVLERHPTLKFLVAHSGGVLPYLAGRLDTCVAADEDYNAQNKLSKTPSEYARMLYYDAIGYHAPTVDCAIAFAGADRLMFGTDHPFSISDPQKVYAALSHLTPEVQQAIRTDNAKRILNI